MESFESVDDYVHELTSTPLELSEIGFDVSDEWMGSLLLKGLPAHYKSMIMSLLCMDKSKLTADFIKMKILQDVKTPNDQSSLICRGVNKKKFKKKNNKENTREVVLIVMVTAIFQKTVHRLKRNLKRKHHLLQCVSGTII